MSTFLSHKIELNPTNKQVTYFKKACGVRRHAYNWGLSMWNKLYDENKNSQERIHKISWHTISKEYNRVKKEEFPWAMEVTKFAAQQAFRDLGKAFSFYFKSKNSKFKYSRPQFKKKGKSVDSFYIGGEATRIVGKSFKVPNLGYVKMKELPRFGHKIVNVVVSQKAEKWFASFSYDVSEYITKKSNNNSEVGLDLGISNLVTTSDGIFFNYSRSIKAQEKKLKRNQRILSKKILIAKENKIDYRKIGKIKKQIKKVSKCYYKLNNIKKDCLHKITSYLTNSYGKIRIESLDVVDMIKNQNISKLISDSCFYEIKRQLEYKSKIKGVALEKVDRYYPSSKKCSKCGNIKKNLNIKDRIYLCSCGNTMDRDLNAAINIEGKIGKVIAEFKPEEMITLQKLVKPSLVHFIYDSGSGHYFKKSR